MVAGKEARKLGFDDTIKGAHEIIEDYYRRGWTDGLPVVPPTEERVAEFVGASGRDAREVLGAVAPRMGVATVEEVAVNAVMAGCLSQYMPVVLAAVEAVVEERFNLNGVQATTHCCAPLVIASGPVVKRLEINYSTNVFGHGCRANATIGRALRLVMVNLGGGHPDIGDKSTMGHPGKYSFCIGVDEDSPWEPIHVETGLKLEDSAVTVFACEAPHSVLHGTCAEDSLEMVADAMSTAGNNNVVYGGETLVVLSPLTAEGLAADGWAKEDVRGYLYERARVPFEKARLKFGRNPEVTPGQWPKWLDRLGEVDQGSLVPVLRSPSQIHVVVAGGRGIPFNALCPGWGYMGGFATTKKIAAEV